MLRKYALLLLMLAGLVLVIGLLPNKQSETSPLLKPAQSQKKVYINIQKADSKKLITIKNEINLVTDKLTELRALRKKLYLEVKDLTPEEADNPYYNSIFQQIEDLDQEKIELTERMIKKLNEVSRES